LGDVVFVNLPKPGTKVTKGEKFGEIESVKAVSDLFSPVSGEVISINTELDTHPELVNHSPHGKGWLVHIRLVDPFELSALMNEEEYMFFVKEVKH
jgi:glycine cleavage system H protein